MARHSRWRTALTADPALASARSWLREPGSLTARLLRLGRFRVAVLRQFLSHAHGDEYAALGLRPGARCWVREVVLYCNETPVIYAHTVLPAQPRGVLTRWFARLGSRSLGSLLFAHPGFVRAPLSFTRIDARHPFHAAAAALLDAPPPASFPARRCLHRYGRQAVLVSEVFLPEIARLGDRQ